MVTLDGLSARIGPSRVLIGLAALLACTTASEPTLQRDPPLPPVDLGPVPDGPFTTDATGYAAHVADYIVGQPRYRLTVLARFENRGTTPLFLGRCSDYASSPMISITRADSGTTRGFSMIWACVGSAHDLAVLPGAVRVDTLTVTGPNTFDSKTLQSLDGPLAGRYQLRYEVRLKDGELGAPAPSSVAISNTFIVRLEP